MKPGTLKGPGGQTFAGGSWLAPMTYHKHWQAILTCKPRPFTMINHYIINHFSSNMSTKLSLVRIGFLLAMLIAVLINRLLNETAIVSNQPITISSL